MTYPLSSDVSAGQPTAAAHYNNLRADALRFGQAEADAVYLAALLSKYQNGLKITRLETDRIRVVATTANPVSIVIDGIPLQATSNVDLATSARPSGAGATYYVFAVRSAASTTFTLSVNTSPTTSTGQRRIGSFYFNGSAIEPNTIKTVEGDFFEDLLGLIAAKTCNGRLTLTSGIPVTVEDVSSAGTVYFTPYKGNLVGLRQPDGTWKLHTFEQLSASLAGIASGKNVDLFIYDNAGTLTLETVQWASDTARATDLASLDGVLVKNGDSSHRFLGTVRTYTTATTRDTAASRLVSNYYNRQPREILFHPAASSWATTDLEGVWRPANDDSNNHFEALSCHPEIVIDVTLRAVGSGVSFKGFAGIGIDSTDTPEHYSMIGGFAGTNDVYISGAVRMVDLNRLGYHKYYFLETARTTSFTMYGDDTNYFTSGFEGWILG